jgi:D-erythronate 2-dehydrogenase
MHILILGAGGMIGRKLAARIAHDAAIGTRPVTRLTLADIAAPVPPAFAGRVDALAANLADPGTAARLVADRPDIIFHLAAIVSGEAEADFDKGYAVNLDATRSLFDAIRALPGYHPRLVFASSIAVFGPPFPGTIPGDFHLTPQTSYGTQKAMTALLLSDYTRRGFFDGLALRLPTICIRPGAPNRAASGFFSGILREPLAGLPAILPVPDTVRHWFASPRAAVGFFLHAATLPTDAIGPTRALSMPGLSATVAEEIEALRLVAGQGAVDLIRRVPDETIARIVGGWAERVDATRATALGFTAETDFDQIIRVYLDDDMPA